MSRNIKKTLPVTPAAPIPESAGASAPQEGSASPELEQAAHSGLFSQLGLIRRSLAASHVGKRISGLCVLIFMIVAATAYGQIRLNAWNKPFYDALSRRDFMDFLYQLGVFFIITGSLLVLVIACARGWLGT
jgi:putative ATP-binding cassette transporter